MVDASVLVTLLSGSGQGAGAVAQRLLDQQLHAPDHVAVEVTNTLRRLRIAGVLGETEARLALDGLWSLPIQLWPQRVLTERTWQLAATVTAYDAGYVALAERLDAVLLTHDARLARASGPTCVIEVLA
ncbi:MAG: type II toxin-antitoxin system VapC family toxin [Actinobacteria bacterium]|nr:type II toxin-antitoxin system VapC family toxin [Actinomycetota bacterium]